MKSRFYQPLTSKQLAEIQEKWKGSLAWPVIKALLWEIFRLRARVLRLNQIVKSMKTSGSCPLIIIDTAASELKDEPVVLEREARTADLLNPKE